MGGKCPSCCQSFPDEDLAIMLKKALSESGFPELTPEDSQKINSMIVSYPIQKQITTSQFEVLLQTKASLATTHPTERNDANSRLIYRPVSAPNNKGLIIYAHAFYHGEIVNNCAESPRATLQFTTHEKGTEKKYVVKGSWERDSLKKGEVSQVEGENVLFEISRRRNEDHRNQLSKDIAEIKFKSGKMLSYTGTVNWEKLELREMLTGKATIEFGDESVYIGGVRNGLMDTQDTSQPGIYKTKGEMEKYEGPYKKGLRNGIGISTVKRESNIIVYTVNWDNGIPDPSSLQFKDRDPRKTFMYRI